ncbi:hypothetical protein [Actinomadura kijaniata]|uniref:hypothetical protein n=1 Tax=Actinomadura kijaniata TaxID=46161 RepID=UPI0012FBDF1C|nr:hypothetical protein [Actinomadura kijaniata]
MKARTAAGRWRDAVLASMRAERIATRSQRAEPADLGHVWVLGSTCYDQALLWDRLGEGRQAVSAARRALWAYHWLDPAKGDPGRVREGLAGDGSEAGDGAPAAPAKLMARAADARARLARLLAKYQEERRPGDTSNTASTSSSNGAVSPPALTNSPATTEQPSPWSAPCSGSPHDPPDAGQVFSEPSGRRQPRPGRQAP